MLLVVAALSPAAAGAQGRSADFDGDGWVGIADFFLFAGAFGGTEARFDLDGDGRVGFGDFYIFVERFGKRGNAMGTPEVRDIGTPVRSVNWVKLMVGRDAAGREGLYVVMGQQAENLFVGRIDLETGHVTQVFASVPGSNYPTAAIWSSRWGRLFVGAAYSGHLLEYDPGTGRLEDVGAINPPQDTFPCRIDEGPDGRLWIGCYPTASLTSYSPGSRFFTRYGRIDNVDMYNYPLASPDGVIANEIRQTKPHVVLYDPSTNQSKIVGPVTTKGEPGQRIGLFRGVDGYLYVTSHEGNYRIRGMNGERVSSIPSAKPEPGFSDGTTFRFTDASSFTYREVSLVNPRAGTGRTLRLDYEAAGSEIFLLHQGPDGALYGSSILPLRLFRYRPDIGDLVDLGVCSSAGGEAYSMGNLDGRLYICSYPGAVLSVYDPSRPYRFGTGPEDNPRDLGRMDEVSYRPRAMLAGPLGRVYVASIPDYGMWGGPLSYFDPKTGAKRAYQRVAGDLSCVSLAWLKREGLIAVGTSISGGSGTTPRADQATLFLWDPAREEKVWEGTLDRPVSAFNALVTGPDGLVYGTVVGRGAPELFVFDPEARAFVRRMSLPPKTPLEVGLQVGPDGLIYGFTDSAIYRLAPGASGVGEVVRSDGAFQVPGPTIGDSIYFGKVHRLRAVRIF